MAYITSFLVGFIALQHIGFLVLEMFLWTKPIGLKVFRLEPEFAAKSATLAANQGLYNGFLAAGLIWALIVAPSEQSFALKLFFLVCILVAGLYGASSVGRMILFVQAVPAAVTLGLLFLSSAR